ncbi:MAG TPA: Crp/Fnr family transcriptional regulator [Clostridia bacterium]|nr:Crp/Fnr family transcriptional regulator [Clostridia bacterium]
MGEYQNGNYNAIYFKEKGITLDDDRFVLLQNIFLQKTIKRDMYFLREGEKSTELAMVTKGLFRTYYIDEKGNDITKYFYPEGSMLFSYKAYITHNNSMYSVQALEDSEILAAKISDFEEAVKGDIQLLSFYKKILDEALIMKDEHACSFKLLNSVDRYKQFLAQYPGLEKRVKQYQLASYLGITPVSLSRIKNKLNLNK